jgi:hypothetical protein
VLLLFPRVKDFRVVSRDTTLLEVQLLMVPSSIEHWVLLVTESLEEPTKTSQWPDIWVMNARLSDLFQWLIDLKWMVLRCWRSRDLSREVTTVICNYNSFSKQQV